ncbi:26S proteasome non-ATPase regulatory subunit 2 [Sparganum proliferum]
MGTEVASQPPEAPETEHKKAKETVDDDLSEEDKQLQDELNMLLQRLEEPNTELYKPALESLKTLIKSSTTSMTSVPKPLKFLRPHYGRIKAVYEKIQDPLTKVLRCAETLYRKFGDVGNAMRCALRLNDSNLAQSIFNDAASLPISKTGASGVDVRRQLAYLLAKHQFITPYDEVVADEEEDLAEMLGNTRLSEHFVALGRELDIMDPKSVEYQVSRCFSAMVKARVGDNQLVVVSEAQDSSTIVAPGNKL